MYPIDVTRNKRTSASALSNTKAYFAFVIDIVAVVLIFFLFITKFRGTIMFPIFIVADIAFGLIVGWIIFATMIVKEAETFEEFASYKSNVLPKCWHITNREYIGKNTFELDNGNAFVLIEIKYKSISLKNKKQMQDFFDRFYKFCFDSNLKVQTITMTEDYSRSKIFTNLENVYDKCENKKLISFLMDILNHVRDISKNEGKLPALYLRIEGGGSNRYNLADVLDYIDTENRNDSHGLRTLKYLDRSEMYTFLKQYLNLDVLDTEIIYTAKNDINKEKLAVMLCGYDDDEIGEIPGMKFKSEIKEENVFKVIVDDNKYLNRKERIIIGNKTVQDEVDTEQII